MVTSLKPWHLVILDEYVEYLVLFFQIACDTKYSNETSTDRLFHDSTLCNNPQYTANLLSVVYIVTLLQLQVT